MQPNLEKITALAEEITSANGVSLIEVRVAQQGRQRSIEITIYRKGGRISLTDCEQVSRQLDELLEKQETPVMDGTFFLEVQSPGIDRKLNSEREFELFAGQPVEVKTKQKVEGLGAAFTGKLVGLTDGRLNISQPQKLTDAPQKKNKQTKAMPALDQEKPETVEVEMSNVISVRLHPDLAKALAASDAIEISQDSV